MIEIDYFSAQDTTTGEIYDITKLVEININKITNMTVDDLIEKLNIALSYDRLQKEREGNNFSSLIVTIKDKYYEDYEERYLTVFGLSPETEEMKNKRNKKIKEYQEKQKNNRYREYLELKKEFFVPN